MIELKLYFVNLRRGHCEGEHLEGDGDGMLESIAEEMVPKIVGCITPTIDVYVDDSVLGSVGGKAAQPRTNNIRCFTQVPNYPCRH